MNSIKSFITFVIGRKTEITDLFIQHIQLTIFAILVAVLIAVPLAILIVRYRKLSAPVIGFANIVQSIPSLALLGFLIPAVGIGSKPAIIMVVMYSLLPIVKNTFTGLTNVHPALIEAADGMGLTQTQILLKVRFPLAMPIIMSGIRISSVTAVGLMTIAAFIGAGGLGYLVFSGVSTVNNNMILAGAIPACMLALILDFIIGKIENIVVPEGIRTTHKDIKKATFFNSKKFKLVASLLVLALIISTVVSGFVKGKNTIVIGSKNYNEQIILGNMVASLVEAKTKIKVERKFNLGGTAVIFKAMQSKDLDVYVEYTGTGLITILKKPSMSDPTKVFDLVKKDFKTNYDIELMKPLGFNNAYIMAMNKAIAEKNNIKTISDLVKIGPTLNGGFTMEFTNRSDGYPGLEKVYNLKLKNVKGIDGGLRYTALNNNETQILDANSTDGLLQKFDIALLKDDKNFFPPYNPVPIIRADTLKKHPELKEVLLLLQGKITDVDMQKMNLRADNGEDPKTVADDFLRSKKLID